MAGLITNILEDIRVELLDEFDQNFERKAFFTEKWQDTKIHNRRGSLMQRTGKLRSSLTAHTGFGTVRFSSSMPYASIHNEGGRIKVSEKMKRFFWAQYYASAGTGDADYWRGLALKKKDSFINMPKRRFLGQHAVTDKAIQDIINDNIIDYLNDNMT